MHPTALVSAFLTMLLLGSCGQVITRITPTPAATPTLIAVTQEATLRPTSTPAPYTPAPTFTPTITPTPIVYQIQSGDSLLGVAQRFGVSVRMLQEANGITDPRYLQIGQEIVIPSEEIAGEGTPTATATPMPFSVEHVTFSRTALGGLWCFGEIHNTNEIDLEQAAVVVNLLGEDGETLTQAETNALSGPGAARRQRPIRRSLHRAADELRQLHRLPDCRGTRIPGQLLS